MISSIIHVGHDYEGNEPWPIEIEDHDGNLHSYNLEAGQMLFYESASCLHGRRKALKGKYYASIFVHYRPVDRELWPYTIEDVIASVPPHWNANTVEEKGNRWAGQGLTVDSTVSEVAPPRTIHGQIVPNVQEWYEERGYNTDITQYYTHQPSVHEDL